MEAIRKQSRELEKKLQSALELIEKLREQLANTKQERTRSERQSNDGSKQSDREILFEIKSDVLTGREILQNGQKALMSQMNQERTALHQMVQKLAINIRQQMQQLRQLRENKEVAETATTFTISNRQDPTQQILNLRNCIALLQQQIVRKDYIIEKIYKQQTIQRLREQCYIDKTIIKIDEMATQIELLRNQLHFQSIDKMRIEKENEDLRLMMMRRKGVKRQLDDIHREQSRRLTDMLCDLAINIERY